MNQPSRRGFLGSILALAAAPSIVRADSLMPLFVERQLTLWGDGVHDDTDALQSLFDGRSVKSMNPAVLAAVLDGRVFLSRGIYVVRRTLHIRQPIDMGRLRINSAAPFKGETILSVEPAKGGERMEFHNFTLDTRQIRRDYPAMGISLDTEPS